MDPLAVLPWLERTLSKGALASLEGAGVGAVSGAATNPDEPGAGAEMGAVTGALAGPLGYAASLGAGKAIPATGRFVGLRPDRPAAVMRDAQRSLLRRLGYDEAALPALETRLRALQAQGVPATLADLGGENTLGLADVSVRQPGPARNAAVRALQDRQDQQKDLVMAAVQAHVTPTTDVLGEQKRLQALKKSEADQQYGAARAAYPQLMTPELEPIYARLRAVGADKLANDIADIRGDPRLPTAGFIPRAGQPATPALGLRDWDLLKRGLDAKLQALGPRESTRAGALQDLRDELVTNLDKATTDPQTGVSLYQVARNQFHDFSTTQEAIDAGRNFDKDTSDVVMDNFNRLSPSDQAAFRVGVGRRIQDLIEDKKNGVGILNTVVDAKGKRLEQVLGPQAWQGLQGQLQPLFDVARTNNRILGGSITQPRLAEEHGTSGEGGVLERLTEAPTMTQGLLDVAATQLGHDPHQLHELRADQLTELLLNPDFHENLATLQALRKRQAVDALRSQVGTAARFGLAGATAAGAANLAAAPDKPYLDPVNTAADQPPDLTGLLPPAPAPGLASGGTVGHGARAGATAPELAGLTDLEASPFPWLAGERPVPDYQYDPLTQLDPVGRAVMRGVGYAKVPLEMGLGIREPAPGEDLGAYDREQMLNAALNVGGGLLLRGARPVARFLARRPYLGALALARSAAEPAAAGTPAPEPVASRQAMLRRYLTDLRASPPAPTAGQRAMATMDPAYYTGQ